MRAVHQLLASFRPGDAISNEALLIQSLLRGWGCRSEIYAETAIIPPDRRVAIHSLAEAEALSPDDAVLLHLSSGSRANQLFRRLACRKALLYHNITPPEHFQGIQEQTAIAMRRGREQMSQLAGAAEIVLADSEFNAAELRAAGYGEVAVMPLLLDFEMIAARPDRKVLERFDDGKMNILFVGRCAPNKRIEDLVAVLYYLSKYTQCEARLIHAGSSAGMEQYHALIMTQVRQLGLSGVELLGAVSQAELSACYRLASVFLCMSEHEGFCIPLLEAMAHDLPVVAYDAGAVAETLAGAGVLLGEKDYAAVAELLLELAGNAELRAGIVAAQQRRLAEYRARDLEAELRGHLAPLLD
jgi:glycosyltransferase involved in cell wall biosynthesis